jgi:hypothetical protein
MPTWKKNLSLFVLTPFKKSIRYQYAESLTGNKDIPNAAIPSAASEFTRSF